MKSIQVAVDRNAAERKSVLTFGLILTAILASVLVLTAISY